jgi:predicted signal transduction protein with EAL and GGDEF domain
VADDIHLALSRPFDISGEQVRVGASIGIAFSEPFMTVSEILRRADVAMYTAKGTSGAWQTITYRIELEENERRTQRLGHDFDRALALQQVSLVYQPILDIVTGAIVGAEALIRWTHPDLGAVPAPEIIDVAEASGNVDTLNAWIFRTALTEVAQLCTGDGPAPFIAVNVSPRELELESLPANMAAAIEASGLDASQVVVELSERIVAEARGSIRNIDVLTEMGVALALDDFGEGRTSLAHLRGFPITYLKLDRVFVQHAGEVPTDRTILHSVVALAHDLGFSVIAEGIETPEHRTIVGQAGAQLGQGYGLHRPMSLSEYAKLLAPSPGSVPPPAIAASEPLAGTVFPPPRTDAARVG